MCTKTRKTAAKNKDKITSELKWQSSSAAQQCVLKQYPTKQKQMNKQVSGEASDPKQLMYVHSKETGQLLKQFCYSA